MSRRTPFPACRPSGAPAPGGGTRAAPPLPWGVPRAAKAVSKCWWGTRGAAAPDQPPRVPPAWRVVMVPRLHLLLHLSLPLSSGSVSLRWKFFTCLLGKAGHTRIRNPLRKTSFSKVKFRDVFEKSQVLIQCLSLCSIAHRCNTYLEEKTTITKH